jgi:hypothetical protein
MKTSIWGWMLGGIPETANLNDMKEACKSHPLLKAFQIEARTQVIRMYAGRQDIPRHLQVKAIYIIGDDKQKQRQVEELSMLCSVVEIQVDTHSRGLCGLYQTLPTIDFQQLKAELGMW